MKKYKFSKEIRDKDGNIEAFVFKAFKIKKLFLAHKQKMLWLLSGGNEFGIVNQEFIDGLKPKLGDYYCQHVDGADWIGTENEFTSAIKSGKIKEIA